MKYKSYEEFEDFVSKRLADLREQKKVSAREMFRSLIAVEYMKFLLKRQFEIL